MVIITVCAKARPFQTHCNDKVWKGPDMFKYFATASALALATAPLVSAQELIELDDVTLFSNISDEETELDRTGATVEVVTEQDLRRAPETSVADVLTKLPGVAVGTNGSLGAASTIFVRGLRSNAYVKVLIDGIDVTDPAASQTAFNFGNLTTSGLGRVELLKGSSSAVYGSSAIAGVVNVTSARPSEPGTTYTGEIEYGSYNTFRGSLGVGHQGERGGLSFRLSHIDTDGFSSSAAGTEDDAYQATQLNFSADYQATDALKLGFSAYYLDAESEFDEFGGDGALPFDELSTTESLGLRAFAELETGALTHTFAASYFNNDRVSSSNGFDSPFEGERLRFEYEGSGRVNEALAYTFGADWEEQEFTTSSDNGTDNTAGIFGELLYSPSSALDLAASLRYDEHSEFGGNLSGRLAAAYRVTDQTILRAVAATGFRAPSLFELNSTLYGNANLDPEESMSFELGAEHNFSEGTFVKVTGFYTEIDNLIQFVTLTSFPDPFTGQYQQTPGTSTTQGVELSGAYAITDRVSLFGSYTYTDAEDANGNPLLRVPGDDIVLGVEAEFGDKWASAFSVNHVANRPDEFGTAMRDYTVANASVSYEINDNAQAYLRVENLFDEDYETASGFSTSDRAFYVGLRANF